MNRSFKATIALIAACLGCQLLAVPPSGATVLTLHGETNNYISMPYPQDPFSTCRVAAVGAESIAISSEDTDLATLEPPVVFDAQELNYIEFTTGVLAGVRYNIVGYSNRTLFINTEGDDLTAHPAGQIALDDQLRVYPHWTLADVFGTDEASLGIEPTPTPLALKDLVYLPDNLRIGINKTPDAYFYLSGEGWRKIGDFETDRSNVVIAPGTGVIVNRRTAGDKELLTFGNSRSYPFSQYVQGGDGSSGNDVLVSLQYPDTVALSDARLLEVGSDGVAPLEASPSVAVIKDALYVFRPLAGAPEIYYYVDNDGWYDGNAQAVDATTVQLDPGSAFFIRKASDSASTDWFFQQNRVTQ